MEFCIAFLSFICRCTFSTNRFGRQLMPASLSPVSLPPPTLPLSLFYPLCQQNVFVKKLWGGSFVAFRIAQSWGYWFFFLPLNEFLSTLGGNKGMHFKRMLPVLAGSASFWLKYIYLCKNYITENTKSTTNKRPCLEREYVLGHQCSLELGETSVPSLSRALGL